MRATKLAKVLGAGTLLWAAAGCGRSAEKAAEASAAPKAVPVTVAPLGHRPVERTVEIVGTLKGWEEVTVGAKKMGRVVKVFHDMGDRVKPGEPIVQLETIDADLAVDQAEKRMLAELAKIGLTELPGKDFDVTKVPAVVQARVAVDRARRNLNIQRGLSRQNAGILQDLQNAENDVAANEAALDNAALTARSNLANALASKVALDVAKQARLDMDVHAPIPTIPRGYTRPVHYALTQRKVSEGQMVREGDAIAQLVIDDPLRLWADVPERFASEIQVGQVVRLSVASRPAETFQGKVTRINPAVDPVSRTFQVEAGVLNPDGLLRPGAFAKASIVTRKEDDATIVPTESVVRFAGVTKLFVVAGDKARAIPVSTELEGRGWVEVRGDLPAQAQVVITGQTQLAEGTPVVVRQPEAKPAAEASAAKGTAVKGGL
jgi:RND family efflux transporter MFP subunit